MNRFAVLFRAEAILDLKAIFDWIATESGNPAVAGSFVERIFEHCEGLAEFPLKGRARDDLRPGTRVLPFERSAVIAYRTVQGKVEVTNVFYGGRDYEAIVGDDAKSRPPPKE